LRGAVDDIARPAPEELIESTSVSAGDVRIEVVEDRVRRTRARSMLCALLGMLLAACTGHQLLA
jgi:hypothetical protein